MKTYYNEKRDRAVWFNPHIRSWTLQHLDAEGNQVGSAEFCHNRIHAFAWLRA